ncbi:MAG TPA: plastocyanin/azurin family copper-binding protein [Polyangiaceae bacterium]|jgi:plastocyanin
MKKTLWIAIMSFAIACSSTPSGSDAGDDSGNPGNDAAAAVNGCTTFTDMTTGTATITGPTGVAPAQYAPNCVHVKVGQSVTWNSDFGNHPLAPSGGDTPTPIVATATGTTVSYTFSSAGTFGFHCNFHPTIMFGAVQVTP